MSYFAESAVNVTTVSTGSVVCDRLLLVSINTGAVSAVLKLYDGPNAVTGKLLCTIDASSRGTLTYAIRTGTHSLFYALSGGTADVTIVYD